MFGYGFFFFLLICMVFSLFILYSTSFCFCLHFVLALPHTNRSLPINFIFFHSLMRHFLCFFLSFSLYLSIFLLYIFFTSLSTSSTMPYIFLSFISFCTIIYKLQKLVFAQLIWLLFTHIFCFNWRAVICCRFSVFLFYSRWSSLCFFSFTWSFFSCV